LAEAFWFGSFPIVEILRVRRSARLIIAVSGYGQDEDRRRSKEAGFDHHLIKPLNHDALLSLLSAGVSGRCPRGERAAPPHILTTEGRDPGQSRTGASGSDIEGR